MWLRSASRRERRDAIGEQHSGLPQRPICIFFFLVTANTGRHGRSSGLYLKLLCVLMSPSELDKHSLLLSGSEGAEPVLSTRRSETRDSREVEGTRPGVFPPSVRSASSLQGEVSKGEQGDDSPAKPLKMASGNC